MSKLKMFVAKMLLKKYALGWLVIGYKKLYGYKTYICIAGTIAVKILELFGYIDSATAEKLYAIFAGSGTITLLEKAKKYDNLIKSVAEEVKEEALQ